MSGPGTDYGAADNPEDEWDGGLVTTFIFSLIIFMTIMPCWLCLRRKFPNVYYPRKVDDPIQDTFTKWIIPTLLLRGVSLLKHTGMNGALLLEWKELSLVFLVSICSIGVIIIMPIYATRTNESETFFDSLTAESLAPDSNLTWITFVYALLIAIGFLILLFFHRRGYVRARRIHDGLGGGYLLVAEISGIPKTVQISEDISEFIEQKTAIKPRIVSLLYKGHNVEKYQANRLKYQRKVNGFKKIMEETHERPKFRPSPIKEVPGIVFCNFHKIDAIEYYEKKESKNEEKLIKEREIALEEKKHNGYAFIVFNSIQDREEIIESWSSICKDVDTLGAKHWKFKPARPIDEIFWKNYNRTAPKRKLIQISGTIFVLLLALFWTIPISILSNLESLPENFIVDFFSNFPVLFSLIQNLLPVLLQLALFTFIPYVCLYISKPEGHKNLSDLHASAMIKYWIFIIFNFYIFYLLFSSGVDLARSLANVDDITQAFESLNWSLYGAFYCNYLITLALYDAVFTFLRIKRLIKKYLYRYVVRHGTDEEKAEVFAPKQFKYFVSYSKESVYFATIMTFAPIVPMVAVCGILAYFMNYLADKNAIVLFSRFDPGKGKQMIFIFAVFINISIFLTFLFWIFFFASQGPYSILYVAVPSFIVLWLLSIALLVGTRIYEPFFFKGDDISEVNPFAETKQSMEDVEKAFSWEYVTDPERVSTDPRIQELITLS